MHPYLGANKALPRAHAPYDSELGAQRTAAATAETDLRGAAPHTWQIGTDFRFRSNGRNRSRLAAKYRGRVIPIARGASFAAFQRTRSFAVFALATARRVGFKIGGD